MKVLCSLLYDFLLPEDNVFPSTWYRFRGEFDGVITQHWKVVHVCVKEHHVFKDDRERVCPICGEERFTTKHLATRDKEVPRRWFHTLGFIDQVKRRFQTDLKWVKVYYIYHIKVFI